MEPNPLSPFRLALFGGFCLVIGGAIGYAVYYDKSPAAIRVAYLFANLFWGLPIWAALVCFVTLGIKVWPTKQPVSSQNATETRPEPPKGITREEAARAFWIEACRVAEATGNPGWRNGYKNFLSSDVDWRAWIKTPLVGAGFAIPKNTGNGETIIWREGIDPRYVRGWLAGNLLPLPPEGWPPAWRKPQTADTKDSVNTSDYSTDTADGATVYASEAK